MTLPLDTVAVIAVLFVAAVGVSLALDSWIMGWLVSYFGRRDE